MESQNHNLKKSAFGGMIWTFAERVCARLVSLIVSIVLARILMPEDYSLVSIVTIFFVFCNVFISGGLNTSLIQKKDADLLDYSSVLWVTLGIAAVMYGIMFFAAPLIAELYGKAQLVAMIRIMGLTFFVNAVKSVLSAYTSSHLQFKKFFFATIIGTVISAVVGIAMAYSGFGAWALVAQEMTNSVIDTLFLFLTTRLKVQLKCSVQRLGSLFSYGWKNFASSIISVIYDQLNPLIVGIRFTTADLAYYTKGNSFPGLINTTLSDTMAAVLFPVMAKVQDNLEDVLGITRRYIKTSSYVMFPVMLGLFAVADTFVMVLLTEKWMDSVAYIRIFAVSYMFNLINVGNIQAIRAIGRSDVVLILEVLKKSIYFAVIAAFVFLAGSPEMLAVSSIVCTLIAIVINTFPNRKLIGYRYRYQIADIGPNLLLSGSMAVVVMMMGNLPVAQGVLLPLQILAGMAVYVGLSIATKNESFTYLLATLKQMAGRG